jgi:hypothetical protein
MVSLIKNNNKIFFVLLLILFSIFIRFYISLLGFNFDYGSWKIVGDIVASGKNVYEVTERYSYGPFWAIILGIFRYFSLFFFNDWLVFRFLIILFLSFADLLIGYFLWKNSSFLAFIWFLTNPISIYTTGFHNQFDNLAIALGLIGLLLIEKNRQKIKGYLLLGLSIATKHIFLFFPLWLLIKARNKKERLLSFIPWLVFIVSFFPFLTSKKAFFGILDNVFLAKRDLLYSFLPNNFLITPIVILIFLLPFGFIFKKEKIIKLGFLYLALFTATLVNSGRQYLSIPLVSFALMPFLGMCFTVLGWQSIIFNSLPLNYSLILAFNFSWVLILLNKIKKRYFFKAAISICFVILIIGLTLPLKRFLLLGKKILFEERAKIWIAQVLYPSSIFFKKTENDIKKPFNEEKNINGEFFAKYNNLGYIAFPFLIDNAPFDFLKRGYYVKLILKEKEKNKIIHEETRDLGSALTEEGILFGIPLISKSKGRRYEIEIKTNIPKNFSNCFFDLTKPIQIRYFLSKNKIDNFWIFSNFIIDKIKFFFINPQNVLFLFQLYSYLWVLVFGAIVITSKNYFNS